MNKVALLVDKLSGSLSSVHRRLLFISFIILIHTQHSSVCFSCSKMTLGIRSYCDFFEQGLSITGPSLSNVVTPKLRSVLGGTKLNPVQRMRGGGIADLSSTKPISNLQSDVGAGALPHSLESAVAAIERWWLVALLCIVNIEVAWRGGLLSLLIFVARLVGIAFKIGRLALAVIFGAWAFDKAQLAIQRGQRPPIRTALLTYTPFSVARYSWTAAS